MKLVSRYATACGLSENQIGKQFLLEQFFPLPFSKYIVLHASSGMEGKNYSHWKTVIDLLLPPLAPREIAIVQVGVKEDPASPGCYHVMGKTSVPQASYLVSNAMLLVSNDSMWAHRGGHQNVPIVELFGPTSEANHSPYTYNQSKTIFLSSHRRGKNPTFASKESPATIDYIDPFEVARSVLNLLEIPHSLGAKTLSIGPAYNGAILDFIPNMPLNPGFNPETPTVVRMDLEHNEQILAQVLQSGRKVNIITKSPINLDLLRAFVPNILAYHHELSEDCPTQYLKEVVKMFPQRTFFTRETDTTKVANLRFKFFEVVQIQHLTDKTRKDTEATIQEYTDNPSFSLDSIVNLETMKFKTNKFVLSRGKIYLSFAHERADKPIEGNVPAGNVIDSPEFWQDAHHFMIYGDS
jgi:hypothetical protein